MMVPASARFRSVVNGDALLAGTITLAVMSWEGGAATECCIAASCVVRSRATAPAVAIAFARIGDRAVTVMIGSVADTVACQSFVRPSALIAALNRSLLAAPSVSAVAVMFNERSNEVKGFVRSGLPWEFTKVLGENSSILAVASYGVLTLDTSP